MKPFLGIDLTTDKNNEQNNGMEFLVQTPSAALSDVLETSSEKAEQTIDNAKLPLPLRVIRIICGIAALLLIRGILGADVSLAEGYANAPGIYWGAGICAVIWLVLQLWGKQKSKAVLETEESVQVLSHLDSAENAIYANLEVPNTAKEVDVLFFFYKIKNGTYKPVEKAMATHFNPIFKVFRDAENLYLASLDGKYAFPLSDIVKIHTVKKNIVIAEWNKEEAQKKGIFKQYKISEDQYGGIHCKYYHILEVAHPNGPFGIYIPCYELPVFEEMTGLKAEDM